MITILYANKVAYSTLSNFQDLLIFRYTSKTMIEVSTLIEENGSAYNEELFDQDGNFLPDRPQKPQPTPLSTFLPWRVIPIGCHSGSSHPRDSLSQSRMKRLVKYGRRFDRNLPLNTILHRIIFHLRPLLMMESSRIVPDWLLQTRYLTRTR